MGWALLIFLFFLFGLLVFDALDGVAPVEDVGLFMLLFISLTEGLLGR